MTDGGADKHGGISRRGLIGAGAAGGLALAAGGFALGQADASDPGAETSTSTAPHQAGITTPAQDRLHFAAFDMTSDSVADLRTLLQQWTVAAARMTAGQPAGPENDDPLLPPDDTGEAVGLGPRDLTITVGFGPVAVRRPLRPRAGSARRRCSRSRAARRRARPGDQQRRPLRPGLRRRPAGRLPRGPQHDQDRPGRRGDALVPARLRAHLARRRQQDTPRNLMGFKDGTNNIRRRRHRGARAVRLGRRRGARVDARRQLPGQPPDPDADRALGPRPPRRAGETYRPAKDSGAPFGGTEEHDERRPRARGTGTPGDRRDAHIRLASPGDQRGEQILRRGYSFTDGFDVPGGQLDAGLFFICFQRDPHKQFVAIQRSSGHDGSTSTSCTPRSALFAVPPGVAAEGGYFGDGLI